MNIFDGSDDLKAMRELGRRRRSEITSSSPLFTTTRPAHRVTRIWQEREGEVS